MNRLHLLLIAGVLVAGSLMIACNDKKKDDNNSPAATESASGDETPSEGETPSDGGNGDAQTELNDLAAQFTSKPLKATYNYSLSAGGQTTESALTVYTNPPDSWRLDISSDGSNSIMIKNADGSFICDDSSSQCFASPIGSTIPIPFFGFLNDPGSFADTVTGTFAGVDVDRSDVTIAGQDGKCYSVTSSITGAEATFEYCFTEGGLLLRVTTNAGGSDFTLEATSIDTTVDPADLELPYPVAEIPGQ